MPITIADRAERLAKRRATLAVVMGTLLIVTQAQRMDHSVTAGPASWIITGVVLVAFVLWASGLFRNGALRGILNDESSDLNRRRSMMIGFWNMHATAVVCYALTFLKDYGPRDAIQIIMTVGISSAFISFGVSERVSARS
ncbi:hypothetical protein ABVV53_01905 [Novosphingobium sp. RD2P27]|uniref:Uncharacterized protein n=1 Tax=Novosphingobium kalidii TaxID=3230299 RepID=A0ABV2CXQ2_9SPHN